MQKSSQWTMEVTQPGTHTGLRVYSCLHRKFETAYLMSECAVQLYRGSRPRGGVGSTFQEAHAQTCGSNVSETMPL